RTVIAVDRVIARIGDTNGVICFRGELDIIGMSDARTMRIGDRRTADHHRAAVINVGSADITAGTGGRATEYIGTDIAAGYPAGLVCLNQALKLIALILNAAAHVLERRDIAASA